MSLAVETYRLTKQLPPQERFGLADQMRRAAVSIPANIAEGNARFSRRNYVQFLRIARGSLAELETLLELAERVGLLSSESCTREKGLSAEVSRLLTGLSKALEP
jgi:four helix bundle protein